MKIQSESVCGGLPDATMRRLVQLAGLLEHRGAAEPGVRLTSAELQERTGWSEATIRHDFWLARKCASKRTAGDSTQFARGRKNGYSAAELLAVIRCAIGDTDCNTAARTARRTGVCIAGLGRLGAALLDEALFEGSGFVIKAGFDSNVNRVEILRSVFPLYPAAEMTAVIRREGITLAVLATAEKDAQAMADRLVAAGISGLINMTRTVLRVPGYIKVENLSILNALKLVCR